MMNFTKEINGKFHKKIILTTAHTELEPYDLMMQDMIKEDDFISLFLGHGGSATGEENRFLLVGDQSKNFIPYGPLEKTSYFSLMYPRYLAWSVVSGTTTENNPDDIIVTWTPTAQ